MPTQITQIDDAERSVTTFRVEGDMLIDDANLLSRIALAHMHESGNSIVIDLADLDFLDSESAPILKLLEREYEFEITGSEIFRQTIVDAAEKR